MNVVHAVLRNWDILQVIMNFVNDGVSWSSQCDLVAIALVCRVLSHPALDILWRDIDLYKIILLFPMDIIRVNYQGRKSLTRIPATPQEWKRFDAYASRIRTLSASPFPNDLFLRGVRMRYHTLHYPFPNLTRLRWESTPATAVDARTLMCPTLAELQLSISIDELDADEVEDDDAVADVLRSLGDTCPRLRKLEYIHYSMPNSRSKAVETSLIHLIRQCRRLESVHLPISRDLLHALGGLPHLSKLLLEHVTWEEGSQLPLPIEADQWIEEADRFPVLNDLTIQGTHTVSSLTECFQGSGCFPRLRFTMCEMFEPDQWPTLAIAEFLRGILRPDRNEALLGFRIIRRIAFQNPLGHDPWQPLWCLSSARNLRSLWLEGLSLDINDTDLDEMSRIWPELQSLRLHVPYVDEYQSHISFQGLAHLSKMKNLKNVTLMLAPDTTISESMLSPSTSSNSPLIYLTIHGNFPPVPPRVATAFLILHFPRLKWINSSPYVDEQEKERIQEIQVLLDGVRPMIGVP